jgi:uncharacterized protein
LLSSRSIPLKKISNVIFQAVRQFPGWITLLFLLGAAINLFGVAAGGLPTWAVRGLDVLSNFSAVFLGIFIEALPFLLLGTLASGFVEIFIDREDLARWIPRQPLLGVLAGGLLGLFFPVCECGVVPFTRRLLRKGVPVSVGVATLLAAPVVNPIVIASTYAAFGPGLIFWGRIGLSLLIAVITGLVFSLQVDSSSLLRDEMIRQVAPPILSPLVEQDGEKIKDFQKTGVLYRVRQALIIAVDEFFEMGRYLVLGSLLAALMQTVVSQPALLGIGHGPVFSVLLLVVLAVLLSVCSTVDAFIALAFLGTFTSGSILAFLVYGPMVDIKSTLLFLRVFKPRTVIYLVVLPLLLTLIGTILLNILARGG